MKQNMSEMMKDIIGEFENSPELDADIKAECLSNAYDTLQLTKYFFGFTRAKLGEKEFQKLCTEFMSWMISELIP